MTKLSFPFAQVPFPSIHVIFLGPFLLLALIYFVIFLNDVRLQPALSTCNCTPTASSTSAQLADAYTAKQPEDVDLRVFLGVLTRPDYYERRGLLRLAYKLQPPPSRAVVDVRFVLCNLAREEDAVLVALEIIVHGDIVVLNCTENMNDGKTHEYFSAIPRLFADEPYDYVGKVDDDAYYRLAALADTLRAKARHDMYHGALTPCDTTDRPPAEGQFMSGYGYIVSWDVAAWISETAELRNDTRGPEDVVFRRWLRRGGKGRNVYGEAPRMYDYLDSEMPDGATCFRHELTADTVALHQLKNRLKWARTLKFFSATNGLRPSKMYHVDL